MRVSIAPSTAHGRVMAPPSKSLSHRFLIAAGLASGTSRIRPILPSQDLLATLDCLSALGARWTSQNLGEGRLEIVMEGSDFGDWVRRAFPGMDLSSGLAPVVESASLILGDQAQAEGQTSMAGTLPPEAQSAGPAPLRFPCRASASTLRFFLALALATGRPALFQGTDRLFSRSLATYQNLAAEKGFCFQRISLGEAGQGSSHNPLGQLENGAGQAGSQSGLLVQGPLPAGDYRLAAPSSSQFITGLLLALPLLDGDSRLQIQGPLPSRPYIDLTLQVLQASGIRLQVLEDSSAGLTFAIPGGQSYRPGDIQIEGDQSNGACLEALNLLGGQVVVDGLNPASLQGDRVFRQAFAQIQTGPIAFDLTPCPDLGPLLFALAGAFYGGTFTGTGRLADKESNRVMAMKEELEKFGLQVQVGSDQVRIGQTQLGAGQAQAAQVQVGPDPVRMAGRRGRNGRLCLQRPRVPLQGHGDHRIVMALALLLTLTGGTIEGGEAVAKSYPRFFDDLLALGIDLEIE